MNFRFPTRASTPALCAAIGLLVAACGGGGSDGTAGTSGKSSLIALSAEPAGLHCTTGGQRIDSGLDSNASGVLDAAEVTNTQYVCHGTTGAAGAIGAAGSTGLGGATGSTGAAGTAGLSTLVQMTVEPVGIHCVTGGTKVTAGADANTNGVLDASEVSTTAYVCGGSPGTNGANGASGSAGADGHSTLMRVVPELAGVNCTTGGSKVTSGVDANSNGVLDAPEVTSTAYICNGSNGAAGSNGMQSLIAIVVEAPGGNCVAGGSKVTSGLDLNGNGTLQAGEVASTAYICKGAAGTNGNNGIDGLTVLSVTTPEGAGVNCAAGGVLITSGTDTSRDGILDFGETTSSSYICNGLAAIGWVDVNASLFVTASPNTGYAADNSSQVDVQLPLSPNIGDIVRVSGAGTGGWRIVQTGVQSIETSTLDVLTIAQPFTLAGTASQDWRGVAASTDGQHLVAVPSSGAIMTSADAGVTWASTGVSGPWTSIASSATGRRLIAGGFNDVLHISSDFGATWSATGPFGPFKSVASSSDGRILAAVGLGTGVWISNDYGANWSAYCCGGDWSSVSMSADGTHIVGTQNLGDVYSSTDGGVNWNQVTPFLQASNWTSTASSSDGRYAVVTNASGGLFISTDSGASFNASGSAPALPWSSVTMSADGSTILAVSENDGFGSLHGSSGSIYSSSDRGATWTQVQPNESWVSAALSPDGNSWVAASMQSDGAGIIVTSRPARATSTTPGPTGSLTGKQFQAIELQYIGTDRFMVLDAIGTGFTVQ
jgi:photosystem II stability/assembly factor-like uncharacterized protein